MIEPVTLEQAGGDRRSVTSRAINEQALVPRKLRHPRRKLIQRNVDAAADVFPLPLTRRSNVQHQRLRRRRRRQFRRQRRSACLVGRTEQIGPVLEGLKTAVKIPGGVVESDPAEPDRRLELSSGLRDDDDRLVAVEQGPSPRCVLARRGRC